MILRMPSYCKDFKCTADKCKDNCCIGWEIDIDEATAAYYENVSGAFGERLKDNIVRGEVSCFKLCGERCAFLNEKNLCDIIINLGEDRLCQICRDHPRYFEWFSDVVEGGIGLSCEEGARLILSQKEPISFYDIPRDDEPCNDYNKELYDFLYFARGEIIRMLEDDTLPLGVRIASVLIYAERIQITADNYDFTPVPIEVHNEKGDAKGSLAEIISSFKSLETIADGWPAYLDDLIGEADIMEKRRADFIKSAPYVGRYLTNIAVYFIWRYFMKGVFDEEILSKVKLMAVSVIFIGSMFAKAFNEGDVLSLENCAETAKNYSKEIEYSSENLEAIYDMSYDNPAFGTLRLIDILT